MAMTNDALTEAREIVTEILRFFDVRHRTVNIDFFVL